MVPINYNNGYLYCYIDDNVSNYSELFANPQDAFNSIRNDIQTACFSRQYDEHEMDAILNHYETKFHNWSGIWNNKA